MATYPDNLTIFKKFVFQIQPIGIKFSFNKPDGIEQLEKNLALCEMIKEAQQRATPFYVTPENQNCRPGAYVWGGESPKVFESGGFGVAMKLFKEARANIRIYQQAARLDKDVIKYISFSSLEQLPFEPDLFLVFTDNVKQTEIILRAMAYTTGEVFSSKMTPVMGCSWLLAYPYVKREVNYITTGFGSGMIAKKLFPEGRQLISIPYNWLPEITRNLQEMPWVLPAWETEDLGEFIQKVYAEMGFSHPPQT